MLEIKQISKSYQQQKVIDCFSLTIEKGEIVCLMGKSGVGKTTVLKCLNQLEMFDEGSIELDGVVLLPKHQSKKTTKNYYQQNIGLVFQSWNLFNHMTVLENCIDAPIYHRLMNKQEAIQKALSLLKQMGVDQQANSYPSTLSGGQKQRVAIARACMLNPKILCFDEPTSALDSESIQIVEGLIQDLSKEMGILIVTHDEPFASRVSSRIVRMQ